MLSIQITSGNYPGFLELPLGVSLQLESYAEAFQEEEGESEFTIPLDVPWTETNRRRLGFAERLENFNQAPNYYTCVVYDHGFPEMVGAKLTIINKAGKFNYRDGKFSISVSGTKGLFGSAIKNKKLGDFTYGDVGFFFPAGMDSRQFAYWHYTTGYAQYPAIRFGHWQLSSSMMWSAKITRANF